MNNLAFYRKKKGVSQQAVADYLGITRQAYWNYENAKREADYETLIKLAAFFETSIENLISEKEPPVQKETITLDAVSYTHLDVYKRQHSDSPTRSPLWRSHGSPH